MDSRPNLQPLGDSALQFVWKEIDWMDAFPLVHSLAHQIEAAHLDGLLATVPAFQSLTVHYDPIVWRWSELAQQLKAIEEQWRLSVRETNNIDQVSRSGKSIEIPVCYDDPFGLDLHDVAQQHRMEADEVIRIHLSGSYFVQMIGFSPGFPYLAGLPTKLITPRRDTPRVAVPKGSVAIGGRQTGIYSMQSPGGWNVIGRTPIELFQSNQAPPCLLRAGDQVRFVPITKQEFHRLSTVPNS